eukprot:TRINITY_DN1569_c0_g1_i2.p1 TRINITY_DN1569_c0_g1~~TRINITY_DN1569_c0_g1_i2.p1  ORF type:complete len:210 (-),score=37.54 TRINITY_DN1569_c0_g1_i2:398-952(-)
MSTFLENYLASVDTLPAEIKKNFTLLRELDEKIEEISSNVEKVCKGYKSSEEVDLSWEFIEESRQELQKCVDWGEEKVRIAVQTYDLVDRHIQRLDQDLFKFKQELDNEKAIADKNRNSRAVGNVKKRPASKQSGRDKKKRKLSNNKGSVYTAPKVPVLPEIPVDPNEPVYCICRQVYILSSIY